MKDKQSKTDLMKKLLIREGLREKFVSLYGQTFSDLFDILETADNLNFYIQQHYFFEIFDKMDSNLKATNIHLEVGYNARLLLEEILDDYLAAYLCFFNGFTKQCQGILRNTLEIIIYLYYMKYINQNNSDNWISGIRGIEKIPNKIKALKSIDIFKKDNLHNRVSQLYDRLCTAIHSHKARLSSIKFPRMMWASHMPSFEPVEILYTKGLFFSLLELQIPLIHNFILDETKTTFSEELIKILDNMIVKIRKYPKTIENFNKGYLIHREHIKLDNRSNLLYSVRLDGTIEYPIKKKPKITDSQLKFINDQIKNRLINDLS